MPKYMLPAAVGIAVLGVLIGLASTGKLLPDNSPKVFYLDAGRRVTDSGFTLKGLSKVIGSKDGLVETNGKPTVTGTAMEITFTRTANGDLLVERMVSTAFRAYNKEMQAQWGVKNVMKEPVLDPALILPSLER